MCAWKKAEISQNVLRCGKCGGGWLVGWWWGEGVCVCVGGGGGGGGGGGLANQIDVT